MPDATFRSVSLSLPVNEVARQVIGMANVVDEDVGSARWHVVKWTGRQVHTLNGGIIYR